LLQLKLVMVQLSRGIDNVLSVVSGFKPMDSAQVRAMLQQQAPALTLDSQLLKTQSHPLLPQD
jgi:hypothetical protein